MKQDEILDFCRRWLRAWGEDNPDHLIQFYTDDALYIDPANKDGLRGREQILPYLKKLLAANPNWRWDVVQLFPSDQGFVVKWKAIIPIGAETITEYGMDIVETEGGRIKRNEVYFDRSHILEALRIIKDPRH